MYLSLLSNLITGVKGGGKVHGILGTLCLLFLGLETA